MNESLSLNKKERLSFLLQLKILQKLSDPGEFSYYQEKITALEEGYALHYSDIFDFISDDELAVDECRRVLDILEMYRGIIFSFISLQREGNLSELTEDQIRFPGFDGNNETKQMLYARYFIDDLDRYDEIKLRAPLDLNSHMPTESKYNEMLSIWEEYKSSIPNRYAMNEVQVLRLLKLK